MLEWGPGLSSPVSGETILASHEVNASAGETLFENGTHDVWRVYRLTDAQPPLLRELATGSKRFPFGYNIVTLALPTVPPVTCLKQCAVGPPLQPESSLSLEQD